MPTDVWTNSYLRDLTDNDLESFHEIVMKDVKNRDITSEDKTILINNLDLWLYCLQITRKEIELQLSQHRTNTKAKIAEHQFQGSSEAVICELMIAEEKWRNNAMKFLNSVEKKTLYVKLLIQEQNTIDESDE